MFLFRHQPFTSIYIVTSVSFFLLIRLPVIALISIIPAWRPRSSWSIRRTLFLHVMKFYLNLLFNTSPALFIKQTAEEPEKDAESSGFVWVDPVSNDMITGDIQQMAQVNNVSPARVGGYWYGSRGLNGQPDYKPSPDELVVYHIHAGGFIFGSGHPSDLSSKTYADGFITRIKNIRRVFAIEYRISSASPFTPANPWPTALIDALAGYHYLIQSVGFNPHQIIIEGDSAGGTIAVALARYLSLCPIISLPSPHALLLISPSADWAMTHSKSDSTFIRNAGSDCVHPFFFSGYTPRALAGMLPDADTNAWISPSSLKINNTSGLFAGFPRTCIVAGGAEQSLDPMLTLRDRIRADIGQDQVEYIEIPDAFHGFLCFEEFEKERTSTFQQVSKWLESLEG